MLKLHVLLKCNNTHAWVSIFIKHIWVFLVLNDLNFLILIMWEVCIKPSLSLYTEYPAHKLPETQNLVLYESKWHKVRAHLINFVPNKHFYNVITCCVGFQFIQPVFKLCKSVALRDIIYCQNNANRERMSYREYLAKKKHLPVINMNFNRTLQITCLMSNNKQEVSNSMSVSLERSCVKNMLWKVESW